MDINFLNFVLDNYIWRTFGHLIDTIDEETITADQVLNMLSQPERNLIHKVFTNTKNNILNTCKLSKAGKQIDPSTVEFHYKYGWTLRAEGLVAFLGKMTKSKNSHVIMGNLSYFSGRSQVLGNGVVDIGPFVSIGDGCRLYSSYHDHPYGFPSNYNFQMNSRIISEGHNFYTGFDEKKETKGNYISIGADSWLGSDVTVKNASIVGVGTVIGRGAFITNELNRYGVYVGIPVKLLKYRFSEGQINKLLESRWWDWPIEKIIEEKSFFSGKKNNN